MKIADFLWPRSREPVLRTPAGSQPGLPERSGNGRTARKAVGLLTGFGAIPPITRRRRLTLGGYCGSSGSRDPCPALPLYSRKNLFSTLNLGSGRGEGSGARPGGSFRKRYDDLFGPVRGSVHRSRRCCIRERRDGVGNAVPNRRAVVIILRRKFISARRTFLESLGAVPLEHRVGGAPDVDLQGENGKIARLRSPNV